MELTFPFRNITLNSLLDFFNEEHVRNYLQAREDIDEFDESYFAKQIEFYKDYLPNFDNEIQQICEISNQETIDFLFEELSSDINLIKETFTKEELLARIKQWNDIELKRYEESVASKVEQFFKQPNRKLKNLEEYEPIFSEQYLLVVPIGEKTKSKVINHNFYCIEETPKIIDETIVDDYFKRVKELAKLYIETASQYGRRWEKGEIKSKGNVAQIKPVIFFEGTIDVDFVKRAAIILNEEELLNRVDLRQRGSSSNLDKLWNTLAKDNWETFVQKKVLIYDCDTGRPAEDFGHIYRRTLAQIEANPIKRGIENLFPIETIQKAIEHKRAFIDHKTITGFERGEKYYNEEYTVNKDEKRNFCDWLCVNGTADDFREFTTVFQIISELIS